MSFLSCVDEIFLMEFVCPGSLSASLISEISFAYIFSTSVMDVILLVLFVSLSESSSDMYSL